MKAVLSLIRICSKGQYPRYLACLLLGIIMQAIALLQPQIGGCLLTAVQNGEDIAPVVGTLIGLLVLSAALSAVQQITMGKAGEIVVCTLRDKIVDKLFSLSVLHLERRPSGWYSQRLISDAELIRLFPERIIRITQSAVMLLGSLIALALLDVITLLVGFSLGLVSLCFAAFASKPIEAATEGVQDCFASITSRMQDAFMANRILRSYNAWHSTKDKIHRLVVSVYKLGIIRVRTAALYSPVSSAFMQVANVGTIMFGAFRVARSALSFADLIIFLMYFSYFSSAVFQIISSIQQLREAEVGSRRINECLSWCDEDQPENGLLENEIDSHGSEKSFITSPSIVFEHVSFSYPRNKEATLHDVSFIAPRGKITALVGVSGGGKTTCLGLIEKFYLPCEGVITVNGTDLSRISADQLRSATAYIDQGATTLHGTLRTNLLLAKSNASEDEMKKALLLAGLGEYQSNLNYEVGEGGLALSGGQRQRLALARAMLKAPRLLLMDEPTASLDGISEREYFNLLRRCFSNTTILYSAHRASLIMGADWIVVINNGTVVGEGSHGDLMECCGYYRDLIDSLRG